MNKINILAVMSLGVLFSATMYASDPVKDFSFGPKDPSEAGSKDPSEAGAKDPSEAGAKDPSEAGAKVPSEAGAKDPSEAGSKVPSDAGSKVPSDAGSLNAPSETKSTLEKEEKRKKMLEESQAKMLEQQNKILESTVKSVAREGTKQLKAKIQEGVGQNIHNGAKKLLKNPLFRQSEMISPEAMNNPVARKIMIEAKALMEEENAQMAEKFQKLTL